MAEPSPNEHVEAAEPPVEKMSYTEASAELDRIVGFFEGREVDVDQLVSRLVRATAIIEELDKRLRRTRMQVEQLVPRLTSVLEDTADEPVEVGPEEIAGVAERERGADGENGVDGDGDGDGDGEERKGDRTPELF